MNATIRSLLSAGDRQQPQRTNQAIVLTAQSEPRPGVPGAATLFKNPVVSMQELVLSVPAAGMVLVRILRVAVCGSDVHSVQTDADGRPLFSGPAANWDRGIVFGHEFVGRVVSCGAGVSLPPGILVTGDSLVPCRKNECITCEDGRFNICPSGYLIGLETDGVFAEYATLPAKSLHRIDGLIERRGVEAGIRLAVLAEPLGVALNALCDADQRLRRWERTILIYGGGPIGILTAVAAKYRGYYPVVVLEPNPIRAKIAERYADYVHHPDDVCCDFLTNAFGVDGPTCVFDAAGGINFDDVMQLVAPAGEIVTVARTGQSIGFRSDVVITGGKSIIGARGHVGFVPRALRVLADPRFDLSFLITRELRNLDELLDALQEPEMFANELKVACDVSGE